MEDIPRRSLRKEYLGEDSDQLLGIFAASFTAAAVCVLTAKLVLRGTVIVDADTVKKLKSGTDSLVYETSKGKFQLKHLK